MNPDLAIHDWISFLRREYLDAFIAGGGGSVKILIPSETEQGEEILSDFEQAAKDSGYLFIKVDSRRTKIHFIEQIFHEIAKQIVWVDLARRFLVRLFREQKYSLPEKTESLSLAELARINDLDPKELALNLRKLIEKNVFKNYRMAREFRIAMTRFCQTVLDPEEITPANSEIVQSWLKGELKRIGPLKALHIFQKITRHNARHFILSLGCWIKMAGYKGLFLILDLRRVTEDVKAALRTDGIYYSYSAAMDTYEVLRQFIDSSEEMENLLVLALTATEFSDLSSKRSFSIYPALKQRLIEDVTDKTKANPFAPLVRLCLKERLN